ncbi:DNA-binding protein [Leuconostoc mesenteroides]|uniref:DNA-binding protein n=1 Tax=Leuconostoc mesenteroides TaxID=1245 RepID=UPI0032DFAE79
MTENLKTIRELAEELGVSKKKIHYQVSKLDTDLIQRLDGTIYLDKSAISKIKSSMGYTSMVRVDTSNIQNRHELDSILDNEKNKLINYLKKQLDKKDSQLSTKDEQIKSLVEINKQTQNLLDQQQMLALQDKNLLEEYKSEIKKLKSLNILKQGSEKDDYIPKENPVAGTKKKKKKWWFF